MNETAIITLLDGDQDDLEQALATIKQYLEQSQFCQRFLLTATLDEKRQAIVQSEWLDDAHRILAWHYFSDVLARAGVVVHITLESQAHEQSA